MAEPSQQYRDFIIKLLDRIHDPAKLRRIYLITHCLFLK